MWSRGNQIGAFCLGPVPGCVAAGGAWDIGSRNYSLRQCCLTAEQPCRVHAASFLGALCPRAVSRWGTWSPVSQGCVQVGNLEILMKFTPVIADCVSSHTMLTQTLW